MIDRQTSMVMMAQATIKAPPPLAAATLGNRQMLPVHTAPAIKDITRVSCDEYPNLLPLFSLSDIVSSLNCIEV
jgi:hypothetical protein